MNERQILAQEIAEHLGRLWLLQGIAIDATTTDYKVETVAGPPVDSVVPKITLRHGDAKYRQRTVIIKFFGHNVQIFRERSVTAGKLHADPFELEYADPRFLELIEEQADPRNNSS